MQVSKYGVSRLENEIKELSAKVEQLQPQECDCSEPLTRGQRWTIIGTITAVFLSFTGVAAFDLVSNQVNDNAANAAYNASSGPWNNSQQIQPIPENWPAIDNWVACIQGSYTFLYDPNGNPAKDGMLIHSDKVSGPYTASEMSSIATINGSSC